MEVHFATKFNCKCIDLKVKGFKPRSPNLALSTLYCHPWTDHVINPQMRNGLEGRIRADLGSSQIKLVRAGIEGRQGGWADKADRADRADRADGPKGSMASDGEH
jgi:hypothetical protein